MIRANPSCVAVVLLAATLLACTPAIADSMRCGARLVVEGDHKYDVEKKCGKPDSARNHYIDGPFTSRDRYGRRYTVDGIRVDTWVYDFGQQQFTRVLRFEDDRLVRIDKLRP